MMTPEEFANTLKAISETGGATDNMLELLKNLQDDFDERAGELERYGERADENPPDGFETWKDAMEAMTKERDEMKERYVNRFLFGEDKKGEKKDEKNEDSEEEEKPKEYADLFKNK